MLHHEEREQAFKHLVEYTLAQLEIEARDGKCGL